MIYALGLNPLSLLIVYAIMGALIAPLTYLLAKQVGLTTTLAFFAGLIVAIDPASLRYSIFLSSEAPANLLVLVTMVALLAGTAADNRQKAIAWGGIAGIALGGGKLLSLLLMFLFQSILYASLGILICLARIGIGHILHRRR